MRLKSKFMIVISAVVVVSFGITFYRTSAFQQELVVDHTVQQARILYKQILLTRRWVADHNGLFFLKQSDVAANPFLLDPEIHDDGGRSYVKRNPAMVTRELADYADREGLFRYRVTSLNPINPINAPDEFEKRSLQLFSRSDSVTEVSEIEDGPDGRVLRFIAPLKVEASCMECHGRQGLQVGATHGGLSVTIPMDWAYANIAANNRLLLGIGLLTIVVVGATIFWFIDILVVRRLRCLADAMDRFPGESDPVGSLSFDEDEVGLLAGHFDKLCRRLVASGRELEQTREQVFRNEKLAALGRFTAGIAHEINNPLAGMLNCVKSMGQEPDNREMNNRYLELIDKGLRRIGATVQQLLNFGRREPLKLQTTDVDQLVRDCMDLLEYGNRNISQDLQLGLIPPHRVDVEALKQVVVNIGLNAIQAMEDGGVLRVESREQGDIIEIVFSDTGTGIAEKDLEKIFDPFFTTKEVGCGTGLGLSVTHSLVERMEGTISVSSSPGKGTVFRVALPLLRDSVRNR